MVCSFINYYFLRALFNGMNLYFFRRKDGQGGQRCRWWWCRDKCRFQVMVFKAILAVAWIAYLKYSSKGFLALGATLTYRNILLFKLTTGMTILYHHQEFEWQFDWQAGESRRLLVAGGSEEHIWEYNISFFPSVELNTGKRRPSLTTH